MLESIALVYLIIKGAFFAGLVKAHISSEALSSKPVATAAIYAIGVWGLSYIYFNPDLMRMMGLSWNTREVWALTNFGLATVYFWLLSRFEDAGILWWAILVMGVGLVLY